MADTDCGIEIGNASGIGEARKWQWGKCVEQEWGEYNELYRRKTQILFRAVKQQETLGAENAGGLENLWRCDPGALL